MLSRREALGFLVDGGQMDGRMGGVRHRGAAWFGARLDADIVPVAVRHTRPFTIEVTVHAPIRAMGADRTELDRATRKLANALDAVGVR